MGPTSPRSPRPSRLSQTNLSGLSFVRKVNWVWKECVYTCYFLVISHQILYHFVYFSIKVVQPFWFCKKLSIDMYFSMWIMDIWGKFEIFIIWRCWLCVVTIIIHSNSSPPPVGKMGILMFFSTWSCSIWKSTLWNFQEGSFWLLRQLYYSYHISYIYTYIISISYHINYMLFCWNKLTLLRCLRWFRHVESFGKKSRL